MITSELPVEVTSTDAALSSALTPKSFQGITFEPYSLMRQIIATEISDENPHPITSVIVHVWICTKSPDDVMRARADRKGSLAQAFAWAEENGVRHPGTPEMDELIDIYRKINEELRASTQVMRDDNGSEPKNVGGLLG